MCGKCHGKYELDMASWNEIYHLRELAAELYAYYIEHIDGK